MIAKIAYITHTQCERERGGGIRTMRICQVASASHKGFRSQCDEVNRDNSERQHFNTFHLQLPLRQRVFMGPRAPYCVALPLLMFFCCACLQLTFQRPARFYSNSWWQCHGTQITDAIFFFPSPPQTGITICFAHYKHNAIIRAHYEATRFILSVTGENAWEI